MFKSGVPPARAIHFLHQDNLVEKGALFLMSEEPLPPLPPSPASTISLLDSQFEFLDMSSDKIVNDANADKSDGTAGALLPASLNTTASLSLGPRSELLKFFKDFEKDLGESKNPGFFNLHCDCLDQEITVRRLSFQVVSKH